LALLAFLALSCGVLYVTGVFERSAPYLLMGAARFQWVFKGPGDPDETYTRVLGMRPSWGEAYFQRGLFREERDRPEEALADFEKASALSETSIEAFVAHGRVATTLGRFDQALWDFREAIEKNPRDDRAYIERARLYMKTERYVEALGDFQKVVDLMPGSMDGRIGIEEAKKAIEQAQLSKRMSGE
jgi:tetratricopeptide (TPR) repeat protein